MVLPASRALAAVAIASVAACAAASSLSNETDLETQVMAAIDRERIREFLHAYSSSPHVCGTPEDYDTAVYTQQQLESFGVSAEINVYHPLLSAPRSQRLAIVSPSGVQRELNLTEGTVAGDTCTTSDNLWPGSFITYAGAGNVTAPVVYANYGRQSDFEYLESLNVTLEGKIALVRYGSNFRGLKVMNAEDKGMAGVIIYSDPNEDGYVKGAIYPNGTWRPEDSFQRGSAQYLSVSTGDPLTPGWAATESAERLDYDNVTSIPHIPTMALSYGQAKYILGALKGSAAPTAWQGGLVLENGYNVGADSGDDAVVLNLDLDIANFVGPIWNVVGTITGSEEPDKVVMIGNHRDAWTCGAVDPNSGSSSMLEIARVLGELVKTGWQPRRTIKFASWDGEEFGLLGSTEYAEDHADELKEQAVAYINVDAFLGQIVFGGGSPAIASLLIDAAKAVPANLFTGSETETSLYEQWYNQQSKLPAASLAALGAMGPENLVTLLGSGSDYTAFYQHLGVVSANLLFMNSYSVYGTYHSSMDSVMFSETIGDPNYTTHEALARWWTVIALRLANDQVVPLDYSAYATIMHDQLETLEEEVVAMVEAQGNSSQVDFTGLYGAIAQLNVSVIDMQANITAFTAEAASASNSSEITECAAFWNDKLVQLERYFLLEEGLPHRTWYKHVVFGPGYFEGYAGTSFPGIADSVAFGDSAEETQAHIDVVTSIVNRAVEFILEQ